MKEREEIERVETGTILHMIVSVPWWNIDDDPKKDGESFKGHVVMMDKHYRRSLEKEEYVAVEFDVMTWNMSVSQPCRFHLSQSLIRILPSLVKNNGIHLDQHEYARACWRRPGIDTLGSCWSSRLSGSLQWLATQTTLWIQAELSILHEKTQQVAASSPTVMFSCHRAPVW